MIALRSAEGLVGKGPIAALRDHAVARFAIPFLTQRERQAREQASSWIAEENKHGSFAVFSVTGSKELIEFSVDPKADSGWLAEAWRGLKESVAFRSIQFRTDDSWLLSFALADRLPEEASESTQLVAWDQAIADARHSGTAPAWFEGSTVPGPEAAVAASRSSLRQGKVPVFELLSTREFEAWAAHGFRVMVKTLDLPIAPD